MNLGLVYLALGQTDDAVTYLERALEVAERLPPEKRSLANAIASSGTVGFLRSSPITSAAPTPSTRDRPRVLSPLELRPDQKEWLCRKR